MQSIFDFIIHPMELGLIWLAHTVGSAGIGIILFTIFVRLVLSPLQIVQLRNAKSMQRIQPLVNELRQKHGKDRQALSQATMDLYREHKVNPAMGCLPTLLQFPILIGLFYALLHLGLSPVGYHTSHITWAKSGCDGHTVHNFVGWLHTCYAISGASTGAQHVFELFHANFLWLNHGLGEPDPLFILPLLAGITQWVQSRMMLTHSTDPQQQMMNTMMNFMPLMIIFFATRYASGLSLYWVTSTLIGIAIQYRITGWGLLPATVRGITSGLGSRLGSQATSKARGASTARAGTDKSRSGNVKTNGTSAHKIVRQTNAVTRPNGDSRNGQDDAEEGSPERVVGAVPRKRANRAC